MIHSFIVIDKQLHETVAILQKKDFIILFVSVQDKGGQIGKVSLGFICFDFFKVGEIPTHNFDEGGDHRPWLIGLVM